MNSLCIQKKSMSGKWATAIKLGGPPNRYPKGKGDVNRSARNKLVRELSKWVIPSDFISNDEPGGGWHDPKMKGNGSDVRMLFCGSGSSPQEMRGEHRPPPGDKKKNFNDLINFYCAQILAGSGTNFGTYLWNVRKMRKHSIGRRWKLAPSRPRKF